MPPAGGAPVLGREPCSHGLHCGRMWGTDGKRTATVDLKVLSAVRDPGHDGGTRVKGQSRFPRARRAAAPCAGCNRGPRAGGWAWAPASQITRSESWRPGRKRGVGRAGWSGGREGASAPCLSPASGGCQQSLAVPRSPWLVAASLQSPHPFAHDLLARIIL